MKHKCFLSVLTAALMLTATIGAILPRGTAQITDTQLAVAAWDGETEDGFCYQKSSDGTYT